MKEDDADKENRQPTPVYFELPKSRARRGSLIKKKRLKYRPLRRRGTSSAYESGTVQLPTETALQLNKVYAEWCEHVRTRARHYTTILRAQVLKRPAVVLGIVYDQDQKKQILDYVENYEPAGAVLPCDRQRKPSVNAVMAWAIVKGAGTISVEDLVEGFPATLPTLSTVQSLALSAGLRAFPKFHQKRSASDGSEEI